MSSEKLFYDIKGVIPKHMTPVNGQTIQSDTPFVAIGMYVDSSSGTSIAVMLCAVQGGQIVPMRAMDLRINLSDDMKKVLAEIILTS